MENFVIAYMGWIKTLHIITVITWMAGLFYLPRLYVYHAMEEKGSPTSELFKVMERRLLKGIMNPSIVLVFLTGGLMLAAVGFSDGWVHVKLVMVVLMAACHFFYARWRLDFLEDRNTRSHKFYRVANEVPTVLLVVIVIMVVIKPF